MEAALCGASCAAITIALWKAVLAFQYYQSIVRKLQIMEYEVDNL